jgi:hypothetical protein
MSVGFYTSKKCKDDVNLNAVVKKIAKTESRSKSDVIKSLLWVAVAAYNKKRPVAVEFPAHNPIQKMISARA